MSYLFTSEAVSAGHPDKICDQISDTLLDLFLAADPTAHTAIEAMATTGRIVIAGETLGNNRPQAEEIENAVRTLIKRSVMISPDSVIKTCKSPTCCTASRPTSPPASKTAAPATRALCSAMPKRTRF